MQILALRTWQSSPFLGHKGKGAAATGVENCEPGQELRHLILLAKEEGLCCSAGKWKVAGEKYGKPEQLQKSLICHTMNYCYCKNGPTDQM